MARRGVFELKELTLKYSKLGGSSQGVREFVEKDILRFASDNPQIRIETAFRKDHPYVVGQYSSGYSRQLSLKNHDREQVMSRLLYLRNTVGVKVPTHSQVSAGVVRSEKVSVQGFWTNQRDLTMPLPPAVVAHRKKRGQEASLQQTLDKIGTAGALCLIEKLMQEQEAARQRALEALPKPVRTLPTE